MQQHCSFSPAANYSYLVGTKKTQFSVTTRQSTSKQDDNNPEKANLKV
jgi:hypothetical protein